MSIWLLFEFCESTKIWSTNENIWLSVSSMIVLKLVRFFFFDFVSFLFLFSKRIDGEVQLYMAGSRNTQRTHASEIVAFFEYFGTLTIRFFRPNEIVCVWVCVCVDCCIHMNVGEGFFPVMFGVGVRALLLCGVMTRLRRVVVHRYVSWYKNQNLNRKRFKK